MELLGAAPMFKPASVRLAPRLELFTPNTLV